MQESKCPRYTGLAARAELRIGVSRRELSSRRARFSSRAQLRSFTGEQQEIWRHQSRRDGAVQETRPGDKLVSLTGELGREEEASGQAQQPGRRPGSMDLPLPEPQPKPHTHS